MGNLTGEYNCESFWSHLILLQVELSVQAFVGEDVGVQNSGLGHG